MVDFSDRIGVAISFRFIVVLVFLPLSVHGITQHSYWFENIS